MYGVLCRTMSLRLPLQGSYEVSLPSPGFGSCCSDHHLHHHLCSSCPAPRCSRDPAFYSCRITPWHDLHAGDASTGGAPSVPPVGPGQQSGSMSPHSRQEHVHKQQRWLLFLRHCAKCQQPDGQCQYGQSCSVAKQLWRHILACANPKCTYPRCGVCLRERAGGSARQVACMQEMQRVLYKVSRTMLAGSYNVAKPSDAEQLCNRAAFDCICTAAVLLGSMHACS